MNAMAVTHGEVRTFVERQAELWNSGLREEFIEAYRAVAPGGFHVENPVGTPRQSGWLALERLWDSYNHVTKVFYELVQVTPNNEVALVVRNEGGGGERAPTRYSLETMRFADDGLHARYHVAGDDPLQIGAFLLRQGELWNDGDREGFLAAYHAIAPQGFDVEYPVGTPVRSGWQELEELWANYNGLMRLSYEHLCTSSTGEAAVLEHVSGEAEGVPFRRSSVHTYVVDGEGIHIRYFTDADA
jgi:hypothetical protein